VGAGGGEVLLLLAEAQAQVAQRLALAAQFLPLGGDALLGLAQRPLAPGPLGDRGRARQADDGDGQLGAAGGDAVAGGPGGGRGGGRGGAAPGWACGGWRRRRGRR